MKALYRLIILGCALFAYNQSFGQTSATLTERFELETSSENETGSLELTVAIEDSEVSSLSFSIARGAADKYDVYDAIGVSGTLTKVIDNVWMYGESGTYYAEGEQHEIDPCYVMVYILDRGIEVKSFGCFTKSDAGRYVLPPDGIYRKKQ